jgi:hypothetical protein
MSPPATPDVPVTAPTPLPPKAESVTRDGEPDGFVPQAFYQPQLLEGGYTRLLISVPLDQLEPVHRALVSALKPPLKFLYQQLTDRRKGVQLPKPRSLVAVELPRDRVLTALERHRHLAYHDGRHQIWVRGAAEEQLVMEEVGILFLYPDDPSFRDVLEGLGVPAGEGPTMAERDYVKVTFDANCDPEEDQLFHDLGLVPWDA